MRLGKGRSLDHYYSLTAMLAARGAQTADLQGYRGDDLRSGLLTALAAFTHTAPQVPFGRVVWTAVSALALLTGLNWLRRRWPTRTESVALVIGATLAIVIGSVIPEDPEKGVLGATALTFVIGYTALFHSLRMVAPIMAVGLAAVAYLAVRIAADDIAFALISLLLMTLLYTSAVFSCRMVVRLTGVDGGADGLEPLTGLLNRESFYDQAATLLGSRNRR